VARILVTGMSGVGKSTVLAELRRRGRFTVETDYDEWTHADGSWDEARMDELLERHRDIVVSGTADNQGQFYDRFEHVVLLSAPLVVILERVRTRTNNPYGHSSEQQSEIIEHVESVEPLLRRGATVEIDGQRPAAEIADLLESLLEGKRD
jgi:shikimate kinase